MIKPIPNVRTYMAATEVTRWHTIETTRQQNLAEHQWCVALLTVALMSRWRPHYEITAGHLMGALTHDMEEIETGDMPSYDSVAASIADRINKMDNSWDQAQKVADLMDAAWFIAHHTTTPRGKARAELCARRFSQVVDLLYDESLRREAVNLWVELHDV